MVKIILEDKVIIAVLMDSCRRLINNNNSVVTVPINRMEWKQLK